MMTLYRFHHFVLGGALALFNAATARGQESPSDLSTDRINPGVSDTRDPVSFAAQNAEADAAAKNLSPDPAGRVGRLRSVQGSVTYRPADATPWSPLARNQPLTTGDAVWVAPKSRASFQFGAHLLSLGPQTYLTVSHFSDRAFQIGLGQGLLTIRVVTLPGDETVELDTPEGAFSLDAPGLYTAQVMANHAGTRIWVQEGGHASSAIGGQAWEIRSDSQAKLPGNGGQPFAMSQIAEAGPAPQAPVTVAEPVRASPSLQYVSPEMVGYEDLDSAGAWSETSRYGALWTPNQVPVNWAPYRFGHWAFIAPWGYTWIDDMSWGFAPSHYGRWVYHQNRWGWSPSITLGVSPVYAPALVAFVGGGILAGAALGQGNIGWFPLGYGEVYMPGYRTSYRYVRGINGYAAGMGRVGQVQGMPAPGINRGFLHALTAVDGRFVTEGRHIGGGRTLLPADTLRATSASTSLMPAALASHRTFNQITPNPRASHHELPAQAVFRPSSPMPRPVRPTFAPRAQAPLVYRTPHSVWPTRQPFTPMPQNYRGSPAYRYEPVHRPDFGPSWRGGAAPSSPHFAQPHFSAPAQPHFSPMPSMHFSPHGGHR